MKASLEIQDVANAQLTLMMSSSRGEQNHVVHLYEDESGLCAVVADYLTDRSVGKAASKAAGATRDILAKADPQTAAANADYHLYRQAKDVLDAANARIHVADDLSTVPAQVVSGCGFVLQWPGQDQAGRD